MNLKHVLTVCGLFLLLGTATPSTAATGPKDPAKAELVRQIESRILEIHQMDKSTLTKSEKKELRKEVKSLRVQAKSQGVYLSVGAIIIIILLLILLL